MGPPFLFAVWQLTWIANLKVQTLTSLLPLLVSQCIFPSFSPTMNNTLIYNLREAPKQNVVWRFSIIIHQLFHDAS